MVVFINFLSKNPVEGFAFCDDACNGLSMFLITRYCSLNTRATATGTLTTTTTITAAAATTTPLFVSFRCC